MRLIPVLVLLASLRVGAAQTSSAPLAVDEPTAQLHQLMHANPVYPPIARAAHVAGEVKIQLGIDPSGLITSATVLSGPPMLQGAALDCVRKWTYTPFKKEGQPVSASTVVTISFNLHESPSEAQGDHIASRFFPAEQKCRDATTKKDFAKAAKLCQHAAEIAETFPSDDRFIERRSAYVLAANAFLHNQQYPEALDEAKKAVAVVELGHDDGSGTCGAYATLAEAEAAQNDLTAADTDLTRAGDAERDAVTTIQSHQLKFAYSQTLKAVLTMHAQILTALGNATAAQTKTAEAAKL